MAELTPTGFTTNKYDRLGRVAETSYWSKQSGSDLWEGDGVELTRTESTYDVVGNVLKQVNYDRRNINDIGAITTENSIVTYQYNWYDSARRLIATANFGTNGPDGFTNGSDPFLGSPSQPPVFDCPPGGGCHYTFDGNQINAIVSRFGYDRAGRRIWSQDPRGIVTRTWYDMLGHVLLEAENWNDVEDDTGPSGGDLTPNHTGQVRYTAYHYTRGGLLDMIVAISPTGPTPLDLEPADLSWVGEGLGNDYGAVEVGFDGQIAATIQATRLVYGKDETNIPTGTLSWTVVPEITQIGATAGNAISVFPSLLAEIQYPHPTTGQPSAYDRVQFKYTLSGVLAKRVDQRNVALSFEYGTLSLTSGGEHLDAVTASVQTGPVDASTTRLVFDHDARGLRSAWSLGGPALQNMVEFEYANGYGNLTKEISKSKGTEPGKATTYEWDTSADRLLTITYPTGRKLRMDYGSSATEDTADLIRRVTGISEVNSQGTLLREVVRYVKTGSGQKLSQLWGGGSVKLDLETSSGVDRFGRITDMVFNWANPESPYWPDEYIQQYRYRYGYDLAGNQRHARIDQVHHENDRSFLYSYDALQRIASADSGMLNAPNTAIDSASQTTKRRKWTFDLLGNLTGVASNPGYLAFDDTDNQGDLDEGETSTTEKHEIKQNNAIARRWVNGTELATLPTYDAAGNLTLDDKFKYRYDAWNRLTEVRRKQPNGVYALIAKYGYDALGRRVTKTVLNSTGLNTPYGPDEFYYDGNRVIQQDKLVTGAPPPPPPPPDCGPACKAVQGENYTKTSKLAAPVARGFPALGLPPHLARYSSPFEPDHPANQQVMTVGLSEDSQGSADSLDMPRAQAGAQDDGDVIHAASARSETPPDVQTITFREFIYGLDSIDELVSLGAGNDMYYVIQDAGHNVVAWMYPWAPEHLQFQHEPFGQMTVEDTMAPPNQWHIDAQYDPANPNSFADPFGMDGGWLDRESGLYCFGSRCYSPSLGRWLQRDPLGQGLVTSSRSHFHVASPQVDPRVSASSQYTDGSNVYVFVQNNPLNRSDPSGLSSTFDWMDETQLMEEDIIGQRLYTLGTINEGARWASLGLQTTLDIASGLLGLDVFQSVSVIVDGRGGFWDAMNIVMAVAPFGHIVNVGERLYTAAGFAQRARGGLLAIDKATALAAAARRVDRNSESFKQAVRQAQQRYPKLAGKKHNHHIVPKYLGGPLDGPTVEVNAAYHQWITNAFHTEWKYRQDPPNAKELEGIMKRVYDMYPLPK